MNYFHKRSVYLLRAEKKDKDAKKDPTVRRNIKAIVQERKMESEGKLNKEVTITPL